ncbi:MAG: YceI family protein [Betaproteobacteria bacterium]|nr:MAG: YceI family protein [Betaproteobacteria bacterium]
MNSAVEAKTGGEIVTIRALLASVVAAIAIPAIAAEESFVVEPVHSQPSFETRHIGMSPQRGNFGKVSGKVTLDRAEKKGTIDITIDATSIRTFDARLDAIVKGERFFNVEKLPTLTFKSDKVTFDGARVVGVDGDMTMIGVTKPVSFKVVNFTCGENPFNKKPMCGAEATATIKRSDWGMTNGLNINNPGDEVRLMIPIEAYREVAP